MSSKYHNKKIKNQYGKFDSKAEFEYYLFLLNLVRQHKISELHRQVAFELIPAQYEEKEVQLKTKTKKERKLIERSWKYIADFTYKDENGNLVVIDVKSKITRQNAEYIAKRKAMLFFHGIRLQEIVF